MALREQPLGEGTRRDKDPGVLGRLEEVLAQPAAPDHGADLHHGALATAQVVHDVVDGRGQPGLVDRRQVRADAVPRGIDGHLDHVARDLQVARSLVGQDLGEDAVDFIGRRRRIVEDGLCLREVLEDLQLRVEVLDPVVEQCVGGSLAQARGTGDDEQGDVLRPRPGHGIRHLEAADAVRHGNHPQAPQPCVGVRGEGGTLLVLRDVDREALLVQVREEAKGVVPDDAEAALNLALLEPRGEEGRDGEHVSHAEDPRPSSGFELWMDVLFCERDGLGAAREPADETKSVTH